ncbi:1-acyl-sn-glycerol-3-phosphate acyltransferase [Nocardia sp. NPDC023852]|uniref:1-acyl-sn-glycerol-3-phosphate acyltransferase n=1 Tax=Nocardia sp. NPDC023852 TaxID=3154697 RepID=UPI0033C626BF
MLTDAGRGLRAGPIAAALGPRSIRGRTTPAPTMDIAAEVPGLAAYARTTVRLHPRQGQPSASDSHIGGPQWWPADELWPTCPDLHMEYLVSLAQLWRHDFPEIDFPDDTDVLQVLWYPFEHNQDDVYDGPSVKLVWRQTEPDVTLLDSVPAPRQAEDFWMPQPCSLHPERAHEYPFYDVLPTELRERLDRWKLSPAATAHPDKDLYSCYQYLLPVAPGCKVGRIEVDRRATPLPRTGVPAETARGSRPFIPFRKQGTERCRSSTERLCTRVAPIPDCSNHRFDRGSGGPATARLAQDRRGNRLLPRQTYGEDFGTDTLDCHGMGDVLYPAVVLAVRVASRALGLRIQIRGDVNIPATGGAVIVANHVSYLDPFAVALGASGRSVRFLALQELFDHRVYGPMMRGLRQIPVRPERGGAAYYAASDALKSGEVVGVFAEATIAQSFTVQRLRTGAGRLAGAAGVPLIPVAVWGTHRLWTKGRRELVQPGLPITVLIGEPLRPTLHDDPEEVTEQLRVAMQALLDCAQREYPCSGTEKWWQPEHLGGTAPGPEEAAARDAGENAARRGQVS